MKPLPALPTEGMGAHHGSSFLAGDRGAVTDTLLTRTAFARPTIYYKGVAVPPSLDGLELTVEVYKVGPYMSVHLICPRCGHMNNVAAPRKRVEYSEEKGLYVERFRCTWELNNQEKMAEHFGMNLCHFTCAIDGNRMYDAR